MDQTMKRKTALERAAKFRAAVVAFLNKKGNRVTMEAIHEELADVIAAIQYDKPTIQYHLRIMEGNGLIQYSGKDGRNQMYVANAFAIKDAPKEVKVPTELPTKRIELAGAPRQELELVFNKTVLVIGRNPLTGRLRVSVE